MTTTAATAEYDVVVGGGSVGGLSFAIGAASRGLRVLVLEEDAEIGEPEKCDGLVSLRAMRRYIPPEETCIQSRVTSGVIHSPSGLVASLDASRFEVVVMDRSAYEKQLASRAVSAGAVLKTGVRVEGTAEEEGRMKVRAGSSYTCAYYVDATGPAGILKRNRARLMPAAKYEIEGDWFSDGEVQVFIDQKRYPGFFAWVIPRGNGIAKVGAAGFGVNSFKTLDSFLAGKAFKILTKVAAPIYVGGQVEEFFSGRTILVGESAGQVKPTTAGGILSSVAGGAMAARWVAESIERSDPLLLRNYQRDWSEEFGNEFKVMRRLRHLFESLSNSDVDKIVSALGSKRVSERLSTTDFDFHATAFLSALGVKGTLQLASVLFSAEARQVLSSLA
ncbi:MAG: NAD(P)/FAD-dependent oxidoreductase [Thaumarchaeota archaeon]|nr:NAD(P)/FAD-dependent oxidoreductase [Nitrososphaerota archaeon]